MEVVWWTLERVVIMILMTYHKHMSIQLQQHLKHQVAISSRWNILCLVLRTQLLKILKLSITRVLLTITEVTVISTFGLTLPCLPWTLEVLVFPQINMCCSLIYSPCSSRVSQNVLWNQVVSVYFQILVIITLTYGNTRSEWNSLEMIITCRFLLLCLQHHKNKQVEFVRFMSSTSIPQRPTLEVSSSVVCFTKPSMLATLSLVSIMLRWTFLLTTTSKEVQTFQMFNTLTQLLLLRSHHLLWMLATITMKALLHFQQQWVVSQPLSPTFILTLRLLILLYGAQNANMTQWVLTKLVHVVLHQQIWRWHSMETQVTYQVTSAHTLIWHLVGTWSLENGIKASFVLITVQQNAWTWLFTLVILCQKTIGCGIKMVPTVYLEWAPSQPCGKAISVLAIIQLLMWFHSLVINLSQQWKVKEVQVHLQALLFLDRVLQLST